MSPQTSFVSDYSGDDEEEEKEKNRIRNEFWFLVGAIGRLADVAVKNGKSIQYNV